MRLGLELTSPYARLWTWAALPFGLKVERVNPEAAEPGFDRLLRSSREAFLGDPRAFPGQRALDAAADLLVQKRLLRALGIPTPPFGRVHNAGELEALGLVHGWPARLRDRSGKRSQLWEKAPPVLEGSYVYERAYPYDAELLAFAAFQNGRLMRWPLAERQGERYLAPAALKAPLLERLDAALERLFLALGHEGVLELGLGLYQGQLFLLDFTPYPTERAWLYPDAVEAHLRAALGWPLAPPSAEAAALVVFEDLEAARRHPKLRPFVLGRAYARLAAPSREALAQDLAVLEE